MSRCYEIINIEAKLRVTQIKLDMSTIIYIVNDLSFYGETISVL